MFPSIRQVPSLSLRLDTGCALSRRIISQGQIGCSSSDGSTHESDVGERVELLQSGSLGFVSSNKVDKDDHKQYSDHDWIINITNHSEEGCVQNDSRWTMTPPVMIKAPLSAPSGVSAVPAIPPPAP